MRFIKYLLIINVSLILCNNVIDVDDILSIDFMPGSLLLLENTSGSDHLKNLTNLTVNEDYDNITGRFNDAFSTMGFHRYDTILL